MEISNIKNSPDSIRRLPIPIDISGSYEFSIRNTIIEYLIVADKDSPNFVGRNFNERMTVACLVGPIKRVP